MAKVTDPMQLRFLIRDLLPLLLAIDAGHSYDPGQSDLDNEQIIHVRMTLCDYRRAIRLLYEVQRDPTHPIR